MTRITCMIALCLGLAAQAQQFEVASIKPADPNSNRTTIGFAPGGRFTAVGVTLRTLIGLAYGIRDFQLSGGPGWASTDRYEVSAKPEGAVSGDMRSPVFQAMLQSMLADRFKLKIHRESKELPIYALTVAKGGSKLPVNNDLPEPPSPGAVPPPPGGRGAPLRTGMMMMGPGQINAKGAPIDQFVTVLSNQLGRPVVDRTGLAGHFDIKLEYTPDPSQMAGRGGPGGPPDGGPQPKVDPDGPSIFTAIQEQLGLKLESQKGPVDTVVIDSVEKPTEN